MNSRQKTRVFTLLTLVLSLAISLLAAEGIARMIGNRPLEPVIRKGGPGLYESHPVLGWRNREGTHITAPYSAEGSQIHTTFLSEGLRKSSPEQGNTRDDRPKLIFVGDSFTQGTAISDHETFPWKIQQAFPSFEVLNYGTGGYGTYQSLLTLEEQLPKLRDPRVVFYGFIYDHPKRNVAPAYWLRSLSTNASQQVRLPWVSVQNNALIRQEPAVWPNWPLREHSALVTLAENAWMNYKTRNRLRGARATTHRLLLEMKALSEKHGTKFVVVLLTFTPRMEAYHVEWLQKNEIDAVNCNAMLSDDFRVKGEGHPNGAANTLWASCIAAYLERVMASEPAERSRM